MCGARDRGGSTTRKGGFVLLPAAAASFFLSLFDFFGIALALVCWFVLGDGSASLHHDKPAKCPPRVRADDGGRPVLEHPSNFALTLVCACVSTMHMHARCYRVPYW